MASFVLIVLCVRKYIKFPYHTFYASKLTGIIRIINAHCVISTYKTTFFYGSPHSMQNINLFLFDILQTTHLLLPLSIVLSKHAKLSFRLILESYIPSSISFSNTKIISPFISIFAQYIPWIYINKYQEIISSQINIYQVVTNLINYLPELQTVHFQIYI